MHDDGSASPGFRLGDRGPAAQEPSMPVAVCRSLLLASWISLLAAFGAAAQQWIELRPPGAGYRVEMPGYAERSEQKVTVTATGEIVDQIEHAVVIDAVEYFVAHTVYRMMPPDLTPDQILVNGRDGRQGRLVSDRRLSVSGAAAREYVHEADGAILVTRAAYANNTLYQLIVVGSPGVESAPETRRFLDSFALVTR